MINLINTPLTIFPIATFIILYLINKNHLFNNLVIIEYLTILILITFFIYIIRIKLEIYLIIYFVILRICERIIGLSILISLIRTHRNDYLKSLSIIKC